MTTERPPRDWSIHAMRVDRGRLSVTRTDEEAEMAAQHVETVIVGAGQGGLATGYHLAREGRSFVILDAGERIGDGRGRIDRSAVELHGVGACCEQSERDPDRRA